MDIELTHPAAAPYPLLPRAIQLLTLLLEAAEEVDDRAIAGDWDLAADLIVGDSIAKLRGQSNPARPPEVLAKVFESRYLLRLGRRYWLQYG